MKHTVTLLSVLFLTVSALCSGQTKLEEEAKAFFWGPDDPYKSTTEIPEKWENESAVILYKNENYDFHKFAKNVTYKTSVRQRIKLLDKASVEEFSEFKFQKRFRSSKGRFSWKKKGNNIVGIKVIKPDGSETEIDVNADAVEVDGETKIAIKNLEVGDIIDYYFYSVEPFKSKYAFGFAPVEKTLSEEYPIANFKLFFETENDFFINFNSYNGAPELKEIPTNKGNLRRYELVASDLEKNEYPRWFFPLLELPCYKFQVYFARSGKFENKAMAFLPKKESIVKRNVTEQEVLDLYDNRFKPYGDIGDVKDFLKKNTFKDDADKVKRTYYFMRHYYLTRFVEAFIADEANIIYPYSYYGDPVFIRDEKHFIRHFTEFLRKQKIDYEIVVAKKRYDGPIQDLLIEKNVHVLLKVLTNEPFYLQFFGPHTTVNGYSPLLEGTDVYLLTHKKVKIDGIKKGTLPSSTYEDNLTEKSIQIEVDLANTTSHFKTETLFKGHAKENKQFDFMVFQDYVDEDYKTYGTARLVDRIKRKKDRLKTSKSMAALVEKLRDKQKERLKQYTESDFDQKVEDYNVEILSTGRYNFSDALSFSDSFTLKNALIKKAGPNYIFEIGKLIGGQIDLQKEERQRTASVHASYPRSFEYTISLKIPEGYTVAGLDKLSKQVDNETGAFISQAHIENGTLIVTTIKQYKHHYEPASNWPKMQAFLDAAFQFTNEKILLKKQ